MFVLGIPGNIKCKQFKLQVTDNKSWKYNNNCQKLSDLRFITIHGNLNFKITGSSAVISTIS